MDKLIYFSSLCGGLLLAATCFWVAIYNHRQSETRKALMFFTAGIGISLVLIYSILNSY